MKKIALQITIMTAAFFLFVSHARSQSISSTLNGKSNVVATKTNYFSATTVAGSALGSTVRLFITLTDTSQASHISVDYYNPLTLLYEPLSFDTGVAQFGPAGGFPFFDATSDFRVVFDSAGTYNYTLSVLDSANGVLASAIESVTVLPLVPATLWSTLNARPDILQSVSDTFNVVLSAGTDAGMMVRLRMQLNDSAYYNAVNLEYFNGSSYQPVSFSTGGLSVFPSSGFMLSDTSLLLRVTYSRPGTYDYALQIIGDTASSILTSISESVTVDSFISATISSTLNGRTGLVTGKQYLFSTFVAAGNDSGSMVRIRSQLSNPVLASKVNIEYFDGSTYQPLAYNSSGELWFGPLGGFSLADDTTLFRISFDSAANYNYTFDIVDVLSSNVLGTVAESVTVDTFVSAFLSSTLNGRTGIMEGISENFNINITAGNDSGAMVHLRSSLADSTQYNAVSMAYFDGSTYQPIPYSSAGLVEFPPAAFSLSDTALLLRVTYNAGGTYNYSFDIVDDSTMDVLASISESVTVDSFISATIGSTLNGRTGLVTGRQYSFNVNIMAGSDSGRLVRVRSKLADSTLADNITVEYFDGSTYQPLSYDMSGTLWFGPSGGFPMMNAGTLFRVSFDTATTYNYTFEILDAVTSTVLATASEMVKIDSFITAKIKSTLDNRSGLVTGTQYTFYTLVTAGSDSSRMVRLQSKLSDSTLSDNITIEYFDGSTYQPLSYDMSGTMWFGPAGGFPLADANTLFRISFDTAMTYQYTFSIVDAATGEMLSTSQESVSVSKAPGTGIRTSNVLDFTMSPNPASTSLQLLYSKPLTVSVCDMSGKTVIHAAESSVLDVSGLAPGTYFVKAYSEGKTGMRKLIIMH